jgi:hypothetical protein
MTDIISVLLLWIGAHTGYEVARVHPNIAMVEPYRLCRLYGVENPDSCSRLKLKGIYDKDFTIYLRYDFEPQDVEDRARLLHELVHWVQWSNGRNEKNTCMGKLEVEAYKLQDQWRAQFGLNARGDPFTLLMLEASCSI